MNQSRKRKVKLSLHDDAPVIGQLHLKIYRKGKLIEEWSANNLVVDTGRNAQAALLGGVNGYHVNRVAFGSNGADPAPGDKTITDAFIKSIVSVEYPADTQVRFNFVLTEAEANGLSIKEFGLLCQNGKLYARRTRGGKVIDKEADLSIEGQWTIFF